jgi:hypothetical protein
MLSSGGIMRSLVLVGIIGASTLLAQHPRGIGRGAGDVRPPGPNRFGNILFPGGMAPHQQTHAGRLGGVISGAGVGVGPYGRQFPNQRNRTLVVPYAFPMYYGDPYAYGAYGYQQQNPNVTVVMPQQPAPSVIINHNYTPETARPVMREYSSESKPSDGGIKVYEGPKPAEPARKIASDKPTIYLIAFKDGNIRQALGYWIEGDEFSYVTPQSTISRVALDTVDRELSHQLNSERNLEFDLNAARR